MKYMHVHHMMSPDCFWVAKRELDKGEQSNTMDGMRYALNKRADHAHAFDAKEMSAIMDYLNGLTAKLGIVQVLPIPCDECNKLLDDHQRELLRIT